MDKRICFIVGAGEYYELDFSFHPGDYIVGADGGLLYLQRNGITADLVVGDFDSLGRQPNHLNVISLSKEKDDTDTFAAVREGIKLGYRNFHFYCCTGGRTEHTLANIQLLAYLSENNMRGWLIDKKNIITAITDANIFFEPCCGGYISIFSHSEKSSGVFLKGLKYELNNAVITNTFPIGVSNEFIGIESNVTVEKGTILIIYPKEAKEKFT